MPTTRARRASRVRDAIAAGGVVLRGTRDDLEVVIAGRDSDRTWVFPKGTPDPGETIEETALREVREESGRDVEIVRPIGASDYWFAVPGERDGDAEVAAKGIAQEPQVLDVDGLIQPELVPETLELGLAALVPEEE